MRWLHSAVYKIAASPAGVPTLMKLAPLTQNKITHISVQIVTGALNGFYRIISDWSVATTSSEDGEPSTAIFATSGLGAGTGKDLYNGLLMPLSGGHMAKSNWSLISVASFDGLDWKELDSPFGFIINFYGPDSYEETQYLV